MEGELIASFCFSGIASLGVVYSVFTSYRNGKKKEDELKQEMKSDIATISTRLDNKENGLSAIRKAVDNQHDRCLEISTSVTERLKADRRDIDDLKKKPPD